MKKETIRKSPAMGVQIFNHEVFGNLRMMMGENGQPFFVGKDVAKALGYSNTSKAILQHVDAEDKSTVAIRDTAWMWSRFTTPSVEVRKKTDFSCRYRK